MHYYGGPAGCAAASAAFSAASGNSFSTVVTDGAIAGVQGIAFSQIGIVLEGANAAVQVGTHALAGGLFAKLQGGSFASGAVSSGISKGAGIGIEAEFGDQILNTVVDNVIISLVGGTVSLATGGSFANGAVTAGIAYAFNQEGQTEREREEIDATVAFIEGIAGLRIDQSIIRSAENLSEADFRTLFPSFESAIDIDGLDFAKLALFSDFRTELFSGSLRNIVQENGVEIVRQHAESRVPRVTRIKGQIRTPLLIAASRRLGLSSIQQRVAIDLFRIRSVANRTGSDIKNLGGIAAFLREQNGE